MGGDSYRCSAAATCTWCLLWGDSYIPQPYSHMHACGTHLYEGAKVAADGCDGMSDAVVARGAAQQLAGAGAVTA